MFAAEIVFYYMFRYNNLKRYIINLCYEYVRFTMMDVTGQLYLGRILEENEWKEFL